MIDNEKYFKNIHEDISNSEMLLIGIGSEFSIFKKSLLEKSDFYIKHQDKYSESELDNLLEITKYYDTKVRDDIVDLYNNLYELIKDKNYFIITSNYDAMIYKSRLNADRIVAPCGNQFDFQCDCGNENNNIIKGTDIYEKCIHTIENGNQSISIEQITPICKHCNKKMYPNTYKYENYDESGYSKQWQSYNLWLQGTLNKEIVLLELGEGFQIPNVIRWPFEKIAFLNNKAKLYRINDTFPQLDKSLGDKGISVQMSAKQLLKNLVEYLNL